jgi:hypothetical protein
MTRETLRRKRRATPTSFLRAGRRTRDGGAHAMREHCELESRGTRPVPLQHGFLAANESCRCCDNARRSGGVTGLVAVQSSLIGNAYCQRPKIGKAIMNSKIAVCPLAVR